MPLTLALYGHAAAGGLWEENCEAQLVSIGYKRIAEEWPGVYRHEETNIVYVDDFKLAAKARDHDRLWAAIRGVIDMDAESLDGRFLGCTHEGTPQLLHKCKFCLPTIRCTTHERKVETARPTRNQPTLRPTSPTL